MTQANTVAVITPAFRAQDTLATTVQSVLDQSFDNWQHWIIADDGFDYADFLEGKGLRDRRQVFASSGGFGTGASQARNVALEKLETPYVAILDADDRLKPQKLERAVEALQNAAIVTTALDVMTMNFAHLRYVAAGPDRQLTPGEHKWVSVSMDSMIVWDRTKTDARYDPSLSNMTDLELLLQLYRKAPRSIHLGAPLHDYIKRDGSMSNGKDVAAGMIASKTEILRRVESGFYGLASVDVAGIARFLRVSLAAEAAFGAALADTPGLLFEDHLEPMLQAARA